jgi:predicted  nucleic acid-binding Zn-ribbon protein
MPYKKYLDKEFERFIASQICAKCKTKAVAIIRTKSVCGSCFYKINKDNKRKMRAKERITKSLKFIEKTPLSWFERINPRD